MLYFLDRVLKNETLLYWVKNVDPKLTRRHLQIETDNYIVFSV